tara:strand:+ start:801 stop:1313 length:513 start_codon:yes stop_codon:yes gene_type:complete
MKKLHINQYKDEIFIKNNLNASAIEIRYTGSIVAHCLSQSNIVMSYNKIIILNPKKEINAKLLFKYYGNFKIRRIYAYSEGEMVSGAISHHFDEIENIRSQIDTASFKYEDMNKTNKYIPTSNSIISYELGGKMGYISPRSKGKRLVRKYLKEGTILKKLISKRGENGIK